MFFVSLFVLAAVFACFGLIDIYKVIDNRQLEVDDFMIGACALMTDYFLIVIVLASFAFNSDSSNMSFAT